MINNINEEKYNVIEKSENSYVLSKWYKIS